MGHPRQVRVVGSVSLVMTLAAVWAMAQPSDRTVRIAVVASLAGPSTRLAGIVQNGAQLAVEEQAEAMKALGVWVELLVHDDAASRWEGGREGQRLAEQERVPLALIGLVRPSQLYRLAHGVREMHTAILTLTSDRAFTDAQLPNTVFRLCGRPELVSAVVADFAEREGLSRFYIFYPETAYGDTGGDPTQVRLTAGDIGRELARRGFRVRAGTTPPGPDQRETTLLVSQPWREAELGKRAREAGFLGTVLLVRAVGPAEAYPRGRGFVRRYQMRYGADPELYAANAYDATMVGLRALQDAIREQGGAVPASLDVTKALRRIKHAGVTGELEFDERGDLRNPTFMVYEIRRRVSVHARCASGACPCRTGACTVECCRRLEVPG